MAVVAVCHHCGAVGPPACATCGQLLTLERLTGRKEPGVAGIAAAPEDPDDAETPGRGPRDTSY